MGVDKTERSKILVEGQINTPAPVAYNNSSYGSLSKTTASKGNKEPWSAQSSFRD